jgi:hypothetical protein
VVGLASVLEGVGEDVLVLLLGVLMVGVAVCKVKFGLLESVTSSEGVEVLCPVLVSLETSSSGVIETASVYSTVSSLPVCSSLSSCVVVFKVVFKEKDATDSFNVVEEYLFGLVVHF